MEPVGDEYGVLHMRCLYCRGGIKNSHTAIVTLGACGTWMNVPTFDVSEPRSAPASQPTGDDLHPRPMTWAAGARITPAGDKLTGGPAPLYHLIMQPVDATSTLGFAAK